jgi:hypothetical protein
MASIGDMANEAKALLEDIKSNTDSIINNTRDIKNDTSSIKGNTATIINKINQLDTDLKAGFTNLSQGMQVLISLGIQTNSLLADNNKQNDTIICWLTNIANTLCDVKHNTDKEVVLQTNISATLHHMDDIGELVNSREAMDVANRYALEERMDGCCPEKEPEVLPCFNACALPQTSHFDPIKTQWKPVTFPATRDNPSGEK